ncbi:MAG: hypothetical protein HQ474_01570, partial [Flammeovirgaceae bacterium]|nr:hypothetical protein [Flammeovirgaceae bacterium]
MSLFRMLIVCFVALVWSISGYGQEFVFSYDMKETKEVEFIDRITPHFLGDDIATKIELLKESYTYEIYNELSFTSQNVVEKSVIYFSMEKVEKGLKKKIKSGLLSEEDAAKIFNTALTICLNIRYQDTEGFEETLWKTKGADDLIDLYQNKI